MDNYRKFTLDALNVKSDDPLLAKSFSVKDNNTEDVVLLLGINPAGYLEAAEFERENNIYLYYIGRNTGLSENARKYVHSLYYSPIYSFFERLNFPIKWDWCNYPFEDVKARLKDCKPEDLIKIESFYNDHKDNKYTVYSGDLFYYHTTKQSEFKKLIKKEINLHDHAIKMLKEHISDLKKHNKTIKFVYINNATASEYFMKEEAKTYDEIDGVHVFYGGMLSSQHAMDSASKYRLINEITSVLKNKT